MNSKLSIIIPVFNGAESIKYPLLSLLSQTYTNFEVIIIDDGSTDNIEKVIESLVGRDTRFKFFRKKNEGVSSARNLGITKSTGEYLCFIDADDYYDKDFIKIMMKTINSNDLSFCGYRIDTGQEIYNRTTKFESKDLLLDYLANNLNIATPCWVIKSTLITENNIRFDESSSWGEDFLFFCEVIFKAHSYNYTPKYLITYRVDHNENQLSSFSIDKISQDVYINKKVINLLQKMNKPRHILIVENYRMPAQITYRLLDAIENKIDSKEILEYFENYKNLIVVDPFVNGLRSIKLSMNIVSLKKQINKLSKNNHNRH